jgi:hypothetical protein
MDNRHYHEKSPFSSDDSTTGSLSSSATTSEDLGEAQRLDGSQHLQTALTGSIGCATKLGASALRRTSMSRAFDELAQGRAQAPTADIVATLRGCADHPLSPSLFGPLDPLADILVHAGESESPPVAVLPCAAGIQTLVGDHSRTLLTTASRPQYGRRAIGDRMTTSSAKNRPTASKSRASMADRNVWCICRLLQLEKYAALAVPCCVMAASCCLGSRMRI